MRKVNVFIWRDGEWKWFGKVTEKYLERLQRENPNETFDYTAW